MKFILSLLFVLCFSIVNARDNYKNVHSITDSTFAGPDEVYLNVGPMVSWLQGATIADGMKWNLMYKRVIKNGKFSSRVGLMYIGIKSQFNSSTNSYSNSYYYPNDAHSFENVTDSTRTRYFTNYHNVRKIQLNLGMEYRKRISRRWMAFTAMDIALGNHSLVYANAKSYEIQQSNGQWWRKEVIESGTQKSNNIYLGVSPKLGMSCAFNSHWLVSLQTALLATYTFGIVSNASMRLRDFDYDIKGIMDEVNLVYRF